MQAHKREAGERVVLIHGLAAHRWMLKPLARAIRRDGWHASCWGYRSLWWPIEYHARALRRLFDQWEGDPAVPGFHVVAHSMGCIITRAALLLGKPGKLHRMVLLAPPNQGSFVARHIEPFLGRWLPPVRELSDRAGSYVRRLPAPDSALEFGIIASRRDRLVRLDSTVLAGEADRVVVPWGHTRMLFRREVARYVCSFLRTGQFDQAPATAPGEECRV